MLQVFISYSSRDVEFVRRLADDVERAGHVVWRDEHLLTIGQDLGSIDDAVEKADAVVIVVSAASAASNWVARETNHAQESGKRVFPVLLEDASNWSSPTLKELAHADFRRSEGYRRSLQRLLAAIEGADFNGRFRTAKQAVALVRDRESPRGDLVGVSQQGVVLAYFLSERRDWETADATDGSSRYWVVEYFDPTSRSVTAFAVVDGRVLRIGRWIVIAPTDGANGEQVLVTQLQIFNPQFVAGEAPSERIQREHFVRFRPIPLWNRFIDSPEAVELATRSAHESGRITARDAPFVLATLEVDKRNHQLPTWRVAFFDPGLNTSIVTVGVNPGTGHVRDAHLYDESLNIASYAGGADDAGNLKFDVAALLSASKRVIDLPPAGQQPLTGLNAAEAMAMGVEFAASLRGGPWQLGYFSNTGTRTSVIAPEHPSPQSGLLMRSGIAGQWVLELIATTPQKVHSGDAAKLGYAMRQLVITRESGVVDMTKGAGVLFDARPRPLTPSDAVTALERGRRLALVEVGGVDFQVMSAALERPGDVDLQWHFRFYGSEDIVAHAIVSGDGRSVVEVR